MNTIASGSAGSADGGADISSPSASAVEPASTGEITRQIIRKAFIVFMFCSITF
jgi:hypothetical protein